MKVICAFDSFKDCMTANDACHAAALGLRERYSLDQTQGMPDAEILCLPMSDGGEGFASVRSINENDKRPLNILMQKDVAMANIKKTIQTKIKNNL